MATKKKTVRYADAYKGEIVEVEVPEKSTISLEKKEEPEPLVSTKELNEAYDAEYGWIAKSNVSDLLKAVLRELVWRRIAIEKGVNNG